MKQNDNRIFRKEDLDWKTLETIGIHKEELEKAGTWNCFPLKKSVPRTLNNGRHPQAHGRNGRKAGNGNQRDQSRSGKRSRRIIPAPYRQNQKYKHVPVPVLLRRYGEHQMKEDHDCNIDGQAQCGKRDSKNSGEHIPERTDT